jgi:hypothetical protein
VGLDKECWSVVIGYSLLSIGIWSLLIFLSVLFVAHRNYNPDQIKGTETPIIYETPFIIPTPNNEVPIFVATITPTANWR